MHLSFSTWERNTAGVNEGNLSVQLKKGLKLQKKVLVAHFPQLAKSKMYALVHISQTCQVGQTGVFARPTLAPGP